MTGECPFRDSGGGWRGRPQSPSLPPPGSQAQRKAAPQKGGGARWADTEHPVILNPFLGLASGAPPPITFWRQLNIEIGGQSSPLECPGLLQAGQQQETCHPGLLLPEHLLSPFLAEGLGEGPDW